MRKISVVWDSITYSKQVIGATVDVVVIEI